MHVIGTVICVSKAGTTATGKMSKQKKAWECPGFEWSNLNEAPNVWSQYLAVPFCIIPKNTGTNPISN